MTYKFHAPNTIPSGDWVWVFASDEAGKHSKGTARVARVNFRAKFGAGRGPTGDAYAIAVLDKRQSLLPLSTVQDAIADFLAYAKLHSDQNFFVTRIGCEHGQYSDEQIGPMFARSPENCSLPDGWRQFVAQARHMPLEEPSGRVAHAAHVPQKTRCPFCGHWTLEDKIDPLSETCRHEVFSYG